MIASSTYKVDNWRDPEMLFRDEYQPFDLFRDINGYAASDFDLCDYEFSLPNLEAKDSIYRDDAKEDMKGEANVSTQGFCNLNTISSDADQIQECLNYTVPEPEAPHQIAVRNSDDKVQIRHIFEDGPMIYVTNKRYNRILKQRSKRLEFLRRMPEYRLPYRDRSKCIKYKTRSKMAKDRKRNALGKFSSTKEKKSKASSELNKSEVTPENTTKKKRPN